MKKYIVTVLIYLDANDEEDAKDKARKIMADTWMEDGTSQVMSATQEEE